MILIYADFMKIDFQGRLRLVCQGTVIDLEKNDIELVPGMHLAFYNNDVDFDGNQDDLIVEGVVDFDQENEEWVATVDWDALRNKSQYSREDIERLELT